MNLFGVVTMDIIGSRKILHRGEFQSKLIKYIDIINEKYSHILPTPISITVGDEWQLITDHPWKCYDLIHEFQQLLWSDNINLYGGIGIGTIDTGLDQDVTRMDGPCFHMAREAINTVKEYYRLKDKVIHSSRNKVYLKGSPKEFSKLNSPFYKQQAFHDGSNPFSEAAFDLDEGNNTISFSESIENIINTIIENNEILKQKMTQKQKTIYIDYMKVGSYRKLLQMNKTQKESISSMSQKLNSAEFFTIQNNHKIVSQLIYNYCRTAVLENQKKYD